MFDRKAMKKRAWEHSKGYWKLPLLLFLGSLVVILIILAGFVIVTATAPDAIILTTDTSFSAESNDPITVLLGFIILIIYTAFITTLMMAFYYFFLHFARDNKGTNVKTFFEGFSLWHKGLRGLLWQALWVSLWTMLFYIPGIVKLFAYSQMFFVLADKPNVGVCKSMRISKEITKGYKGDLFFMSLSFIGWLILAMIPYTIGFTLYAISPDTNLPFLFIGLFVYLIIVIILLPYIATTYIYAYEYLLKSALDRKIISYEDIGEKSPVEAIEQ